jgi:peptidoglycan/LPS O-acetylase OafA/YrhL
VTTPERNTRFDALDGLRGICACLVYFYHRSIWQDYLSPEYQANGLIQHLLESVSKLGVCVFFVLSAFLFTRKVLNNEITNPLNFVLGRFFRIAPLCWFVILFVVTYSVLDTHGIGIGNTDFGKRLAIWMSGGLRDGPTPLVQPMSWWHFVAGNWWTLRHEWLLYSLVPITAAFIGKLSNKLIYAGTTLGLLLLFKDISGVLLHSANVSFIGGIILALAVNRPTAMWSVVLMAIVSIVSIANVFHLPDYFPYAIPATTITFLFLRHSQIQIVMGTKIVKSIGESSFSIYMLHGIVIFLTIKIAKVTTWIPYSIICTLQFIVVLALSRLIFLVVELPGVKLGKTVTAKLVALSRFRYL